MAGYGYGSFGYGGLPGPFSGGYFKQEFGRESIGFGPQGFGLYEQGTQINRDPFTGATTIRREAEFIPAGGAVRRGLGYGSGYGYSYF